MAARAPGRRAPRGPVVVLGEAVLELLRTLSAGHRAVLLLDDLHWADRDTLGLLEYLVDGLRELPVRVVGSARDDEAAPDGLVALGRHPRVQSLPLLVEELLAGLVESGSVRRVDGRVEPVGALQARVPRAFAGIVDRRVAALAPAEREVLRTAAVLGQDVDWRLVAAATGADVGSALRAAVDMGLMLAGPDGSPRWRHALTCDAVLAALTAPERAALAARAARRLDTGSPVARPGLVADLHARGGRPDRAAEVMLEQARESTAAGALADASSVLERAVVLAVGRPGLLAAIAVERVRVLALGARTDDAVDVADAVLPALRGPQRTALTVAAARACVAADRFAEARRFLDAADPGDPGVLALAAHVALGAGNVDRALEIAGAAVGAAENAGLPEVECEALEVVGRGLRRRDPPASRGAFRRAEEVAALHALVPWRIRALAELGANAMLDSGATNLLAQAAALAVDAGMLGTATMLDLQITIGTVAVDGYVATMPMAERCAERAGRLRLAGTRAVALIFAARGRVFAGRMSEAEALLDDATRVAPDELHVRVARFDLRGRDVWLAGDDERAVRELGDGVAVLRRGAGTNAAPMWGEWALLRTVLDPADDGPRTELRHSDVLVTGINRAALRYADAVAAAVAGRDEAAAELLVAGDDLLAGQPYFRYLLRTMLLPLAGTPGLGDPAAFLREVLAWLAGRGEVQMVRLCQAHLRRLGLPVPRPDRDVEAVPPRLRGLGVTGRELAVLRLVAAGLGNPEIAARLHLSRRTVETHVGNLLAKTGATGRDALADALAP
ncbi:MAG TPA: LuxR C-terminal-related transcriptional regulator [Mycobacteriales bacterium]|nr:LuxR C-terminal-related transcriptional regulator [Mycobacteriales bacterium]